MSTKFDSFDATKFNGFVQSKLDARGYGAPPITILPPGSQYNREDSPYGTKRAEGWASLGAQPLGKVVLRAAPAFGEPFPVVQRFRDVLNFFVPATANSGLLRINITGRFTSLESLSIRLYSSSTAGVSQFNATNYGEAYNFAVQESTSGSNPALGTLDLTISVATIQARRGAFLTLILGTAHELAGTGLGDGPLTTQQSRFSYNSAQLITA